MAEKVADENLAPGKAADSIENKSEEKAPDVVSGELCPICQTKNLILTEQEREIPYFGRVLLFSMTCTNCKFHKADVEAMETKPKCKFTIEVSGEEDMKIRVVKSSQATVKVPFLATIEPGEGSNGYISNIEGLLTRIKAQIEFAMKDEEDPESEKKGRKLLKKISRTMYGSESLKIIIDDPSGNSAIISEKAVKS